MPAGAVGKAGVVGKEELLTLLKRAAKAHGLHCQPVDHEGLRAEREVILARWFFGGRKVAYHASCRLDEASHAVRYRELVKETSWGIPAPFFVAEKATGAATRATGTRLEGDADAGLLEFDRIREAIEHAVRQAGWLFHFEAGHP